MKKFNINEHMYIQINEHGWKHLENTVGTDYINACIKNREVIIEGEKWYKLQCWGVFDLFPSNFGQMPYFSTNVMFDEKSLT